ncbi:VOC family protein [Saccharospirillum mangrovi]|uniref:VOC family protein n=1 Tax=Saccharospirillum mangrovi TaxID=2161747 RepID=UPI000D3D8250|nr:VOC family protein [Saccharospirillum mangrovi]
MALDAQPVAWFEIPVSDMNRARAFYEAVLEVSLQPLDLGENFKMALFPASDHRAGALMQANSYEPSYQGPLIYLGVDDIDATLDRAAQHGGKVINAKMSIGERGFVGHFEDCEGNRIGLHSLT